ncbi:hypothetical protein CVT24_009372 [Panaeolus cyanescens]|uniref:Ribonuclease H1 N-terminal domain-containing protein n=1 Tax=Panaeolus cyanescens TaxID=181874 RepID=A0A409WEM2_9AGAR|nr:hypothetical protein CVT24_009372 [Panaeolus cyanescens]
MSKRGSQHHPIPNTSHSAHQLSHSDAHQQVEYTADEISAFIHNAQSIKNSSNFRQEVQVMRRKVVDLLSFLDRLAIHGLPEDSDAQISASASDMAGAMRSLSISPHTHAQQHPTRAPVTTNPAASQHRPPVNSVHNPNVNVKQRNGAGRYYTVTVGRNIGVFEDWEYVCALTNGISGAAYRKHYTYDEAWAVYQDELRKGTPRVARRTGDTEEEWGLLSLSVQ